MFMLMILASLIGSGFTMLIFIWFASGESNEDKNEKQVYDKEAGTAEFLDRSGRQNHAIKMSKVRVGDEQNPTVIVEGTQEVKWEPHRSYEANDRSKRFPQNGI